MRSTPFSIQQYIENCPTLGRHQIPFTSVPFEQTFAHACQISTQHMKSARVCQYSNQHMQCHLPRSKRHASSVPTISAQHTHAKYPRVRQRFTLHTRYDHTRSTTMFHA
ncbi:unnamed protein product [Sphacelaria rigidula]